MGEGVLVIGSVAHVSIYKNIGLQVVVDLIESACIPGIGFYKITIQVVIAGVSSKSIFSRAVLIGSGSRVAI